MNKTVKFLLKLIVSTSLLVWVLYGINWSEVVFYLGEIRWWQIALYLAAILLGMVISAYKWQLLAHSKGFMLPLADFFKLYFTGSFINNFMPSFIGGDTYRAYELGKKTKQYPEAASTVMMDRITGFVGGSIIAFVFAIFNLDTILKSKALMGFYLLLILSFGLDVFLPRFRHSTYLRQKFGKYIPQKIKIFLNELGRYNNDSGILSKATLGGAIFAFVGVAIPNYILFWSLGIHIDILDYLSTIFIISIISVIPISINNIGLKEWAYVTFFGIYGISSASVISVALLSRFLQMLLSFFALPLYLKSKK
ncbi:MAG: lysylphosphatidylglycerol synthase transmembrane domain-containing protein [Parcubacteria group bacterium]|jgi:hypothetical protein